jgi:hypothetical protein
MHTVKVNLISDQFINFPNQGIKETSIHDIETIVIDSNGKICKVYTKEEVEKSTTLGMGINKPNSS